MSQLQLWREHGLESILRDAAQAHSVNAEEILGRGRHASVVRARRDLICTLRAEPYRRSWPEIAMLMDRDHTSVMSLARSASEHPPKIRGRATLAELIAAVDAAREELRCT